ncbi:MAG: GSCFA domain-containing protein [Bacteroidales bacterium]
MSDFRTTFTIPEFPFKLNYHSKSIFIGSCFTENIGNYMKELKFQLVQNPTGILYNPISINECLEYMMDGKKFSEGDLRQYNDVWFSFHHHGRFSDTDKNKCLKNINAEISAASEFLTHADFLFITFGSAYIYKLNETNEVVANCHKLPSNTFTKSLLDIQTIKEAYLKTIGKLNKLNPKLKIIFTLSPVRHWNDGAEENQLSKSVLSVAIHEIIKNNTCCYYFPAYELMMDDLRDYRFYAEDMLHPNKSAIDYIWNKFSDSLIENDSKDIMKEIQKLIIAKSHRPFHTETPSYKKFKVTMQKQTMELKKKFPFLDLNGFESFFNE